MGQFPRSQYMVASIVIPTSGATLPLEFYFPRAARILRYAVTPAVAQAAHATIVVGGVFTNKSATKSAAWVAHDALEIITNNRPGSPTSAQNSFDEIAAGSVINYIATAAGTTPTASHHTVLIEFVESD